MGPLWRSFCYLLFRVLEESVQKVLETLRTNASMSHVRLLVEDSCASEQASTSNMEIEFRPTDFFLRAVSGDGNLREGSSVGYETCRLPNLN